MMVLELRDKIIEDGIVSVKKHETRPERRRGGIHGFELCRELNSPTDYEKALQERYKEERRLAHLHTTDETITREAAVTKYWEYRYATVQIEFVWERMKVAWALGGTYSAKAAIHVNELLKERA